MDLVTPTWPEFSGAVRGFVTEAPTALGKPFEVMVPDFSSERSYEIRRWAARGLTLPALGDEVLVVEDEHKLPWVPVWWPSAGDISLARDYGIVEALPAGTIAKGSLCTYKAATGIYWRLLYTGEATYPWAKVGGPALRNFVVEATNATEVLAKVNEFTTPLAMEADVTWASLRVITGTSAFTSFHLYIAGSIAAETYVGTSIQGIGGGQLRPTLAKSALIETRMARLGGSGSAQLIGASLRLDPLRVG